MSNHYLPYSALPLSEDILFQKPAEMRLTTNICISDLRDEQLIILQFPFPS